MPLKISTAALHKWADFILNHSLHGITPDDVVMIKGEHICWPLMSVLQDKIIAAGAIPDINIVAPDNDRGKVFGAAMARQGNLAQIRRVPDWQRRRYEHMTKFIEILGAENPDLYASVPAETSQAITRVNEPLVTIRLTKPWVLTLFPTRGFADLEKMSLSDYTRVIVRASTTDPMFLEKIQRPLYELMQRSKTIRIITRHPKGKTLELQMNIAGRIVHTCTGENNFPDGEVYTSPDANSVQGEIFVDLPVLCEGNHLQGIYLQIDGGVIRNYSARQGSNMLGKIIETDPGSHRLGEVAFGMNNGIKKALRHPLFLEKIGGTLHIAIGASYNDCYVSDPQSPEGEKQLEEYFKQGILNRSARHVDIVTDFRQGGCGQAVYLDQTRLAVKNNLWLIP
jgi:aminopeptidase